MDKYQVPSVDRKGRDHAVSRSDGFQQAIAPFLIPSSLISHRKSKKLGEGTVRALRELLPSDKYRMSDNSAVDALTVSDHSDTE